jgi:hypothetical protein
MKGRGAVRVGAVCFRRVPGKRPDGVTVARFHGIEQLLVRLKADATSSEAGDRKRRNQTSQDDVSHPNNSVTLPVLSPKLVIGLP